MIETREQVSLQTAVALYLWAMAGGASLIIGGRAIAGAFDQTVAPYVPVLATVVIGMMSLSAWTLFHRETGRGDVGRRLSDGLFSLVPPTVTGFATCPGAPPTTLAFISLLLVCGLVYVVAREGLRPLRNAIDASASSGPQASQAIPPPQTSSAARSLPPAETVAAAEAVPVTDAFSSISEPADESGPVEDSDQRLTRRTLAAGEEEIEAVVKVRFEPGQKVAVVHLPIHPVLSGQLQVECEPIDDSEVSTQVTGTHAYGVRVEVKRSADLNTIATVPIGLLITSRQRHDSAA